MHHSRNYIFIFAEHPQQTFIDTGEDIFSLRVSPASASVSLRRYQATEDSRFLLFFLSFHFSAFKPKAKASRKNRAEEKAAEWKLYFRVYIPRCRRWYTRNIDSRCSRWNDNVRKWIFHRRTRNTGVNNWAIRFLISVEFVCLRARFERKSFASFHGWRRKLFVSARFVEL